MKDSEGKKWLCEEGRKKIGIARSLVILFSQILINLLEWNGSIFGRTGITNIFVILQFSTIVLHWRIVEGVVAVVGRGQGIASLVELRCVQFLVVFCCNFRRKICTKKGWLWVGGGGGGAVPSGVRTNPPNQVILPPSSFFLKSPRICFRGLQRWWELSSQTKTKTKNRTHP